MGISAMAAPITAGDQQAVPDMGAQLGTRVNARSEGRPGVVADWYVDPVYFPRHFLFLVPGPSRSRASGRPWDAGGSHDPDADNQPAVRFPTDATSIRDALAAEFSATP